jgi:hypothetical protein
MKTTAAKRIAATGYASRMKSWERGPEIWTVTTERGIEARNGASMLNTQECQGLVCAGVLRRVEVLRLTGAIIYKLVQP